MKIILLRFVGALLTIIGLVAGYIWFYHLGPLRCVCDPKWNRQHSDVARWNECQKCIARTGWHHEAGFEVGDHGNKAWMERIMAKLKPNDRLDCFYGHKGVALQKMTNQDAGESATAWIAWWEQNRSKSQEDWIRDGFRKNGVELQTPLTPSNITALLKLVAKDGEVENKVPDYIRYNAFRWLRDSDFDPRAFAFADIPPKDSNEVLRGLVRFAKQTGESPKWYGLGVLNLGEKYPTYSQGESLVSTTRFQAIAYSIVFVPLCMGLLLLWVSVHVGRRKAHSECEQVGAAQ